MKANLRSPLNSIKTKFLAIALVPVLVFACNPSKKEENLLADKDWEVLFDGTSTDAFRGYGINEFPEGLWIVENGILMTNPDTANRDLITKKRYKDFELEYEWAVDTAANSGVFFHMQENLSMEAGNGNSPNWMDNFEIQILEDTYFTILQPSDPPVPCMT